MTTTLAVCFQAYCDKRLPLGSDSTIRQFEINLRRFSGFLGRDATTDDLSDDVLQRVMVGMVKRDGLEPRTANKFRDNMLSLWRFLCRRGELLRWPEVSPLKEPHRDPVAWSREQLTKLFKACSEQSGDFDGVPASLWWHCLHAVAWDTGERISGLLSLMFCDVDLESRWITIRAEGRKGKAADKSSRLHADTARLISEIRLPRRELVFAWPFHRLYLWPRYGKLLESAGLPNDRRHKFHCLRKSAASYFEAAGGSAQELLGHSDGRVTRQNYLDPKIVCGKQAADVLFRPDTPHVS